MKIHVLRSVGWFEALAENYFVEWTMVEQYKLDWQKMGLLESGRLWQLNGLMRGSQNRMVDRNCKIITTNEASLVINLFSKWKKSYRIFSDCVALWSGDTKTRYLILSNLSVVCETQAAHTSFWLLRLYMLALNLLITTLKSFLTCCISRSNSWY